MKLIIFVAATMSALAVVPSVAQDYSDYPAPTRYPFQRSYRTGEVILIPPYRHPFVERVYTTPPRQPLYNVPPYSVVAPY